MFYWVLGILILCFLAEFLICVNMGIMISRHAFESRFDGGGDYFPYYSEKHPGWARKPVSFQSRQGVTLRGFLFSYPDITPKALIVLYHGYGMGLDDYLPECEYFCRRGYLVLAFDGSGTGHSDGILSGLPQHIFDLVSCLDYVSADENLTKLPLLLYGHSWGGYACDALGAMADFPVRGIVSASGFSTSYSALLSHALRHYNALTAHLAMLGVRLHQRVQFGSCASLTAIDGLERQTCPILITQSDDDGIISYKDNYGRLYRRFRACPNVRFLPLTGRNHNILTPPEVDEAKRKLLKELRSDHVSPETIETMNHLKEAVDYDLLKIFADFFDECL